MLVMPQLERALASQRRARGAGVAPTLMEIMARAGESSKCDVVCDPGSVHIVEVLPILLACLLALQRYCGQSDEDGLLI